MANEKRLIDYYVVRNKSTGFYFRGKGVNRWGEYYNQASIYRIKAHAQNTANWLNARGEKVEIVPIRITENPTEDVVEVVHGRWEPRQDVIGFVRCSVCHDCNIYGDWADGKKWNYCPNCGAKMDGDGNA